MVILLVYALLRGKTEENLKRYTWNSLIVSCSERNSVLVKSH